MIRDVRFGVFELDGALQLAFPGFPGRPDTDYTGPLGTAETASLGIVWPLAGGGPRRLVVKRFTNPVQRLEDGFVPGVPVESRAGLAFETFRDQPLSFGSGFPLVLWFVRPYPGGWAGDVTRAVYEILRNCGVRVCTEPPDAPPGDYGVVAIGAATAWSGGAGTDPAAVRFPTRRGGGTTVMMLQTAFPNDVGQTAAGAAHEAGHGWLGPDHSTEPGNLMQPAPVGTSRLNAAQEAIIRGLTAAWR